MTLLPIIAAITVSSSVNLSCVFIRLKLSMGRYWNVRVLERRFSLINSSHLYSTQSNYRSTPNYPTKAKARVPLSLFVALRLFSRADTRSGVHITRFSQKSKNVPLLAKNVPLCFFSRCEIVSLNKCVNKVTLCEIHSEII